MTVRLMSDFNDESDTESPSTWGKVEISEHRVAVEKPRRDIQFQSTYMCYHFSVARLTTS